MLMWWKSEMNLSFFLPLVTHTARDGGGQTRDLPASGTIPLHVMMWP